MSTVFGTYSQPMSPTDDPIWGNARTEAVWWHDKDPTDLVTSLRGIELYNAAGDGTLPPDELQASGPTAALGSYEEVLVRQQNIDFNRALKRAGISHTWVPHEGTHDSYYWVQELHQWAPMMMSVFNHPSPTPAQFDYRTADPAFSVWGWTFKADPRRAAEFLDITGASADGLTLTGSGTTTVQTAAVYDPGQPVHVSNSDGTTRVLTADGTGRLAFTVSLGPPHTAQQYTAREAALAKRPGYFTTRTITLQPT
jgi:hypothetical protein